MVKAHRWHAVIVGSTVKAHIQFNFCDRTHASANSKGQEKTWQFFLSFFSFSSNLVFAVRKVCWQPPLPHAHTYDTHHTFVAQHSYRTKTKNSYVRCFYLDSVFISLRFVRCCWVNKEEIAFLVYEITFYLFPSAAAPLSFWFHLLLP